MDEKRYRPEPTIGQPDAKPYAVFDTEYRQYKSFHTSWNAAKRAADKHNRNHTYARRAVDRMRAKIAE